MPLSNFLSTLTRLQHTTGHTGKLKDRLIEIVQATWHLGFTAFGGPPAHFQIFHKRFVEEGPGRTPWITEQTYQELFALCQALPGPASTKFLFAIILLHAGFVAAGVGFLIWSLPGAVGMYGLALGVNDISDTLPDPAYAFLSGLNAATVGIIAVAAVGLAEKCITDNLSRLLVIFGACTGLCYSALWYYPVLIAIGGVSAVVWDLWLGRRIRLVQQRWEARRRRAADRAATAEHDAVAPHHEVESSVNDNSIELQRVQQATVAQDQSEITQRRQNERARVEPAAEPSATVTSPAMASLATSSSSEHEDAIYGVGIKTGTFVLGVFAVLFIAIMVARSFVPHDDNNRPLAVFANMYLAGTIIFGGGPVVIPLLREYVVTPGYVSPRDFLIGLAIIQAFPGPNFNFAVYLGALAVVSTAQFGEAGSSLLGAFIGYVGIFLPGLMFAVFIQSVRRSLRKKALFLALLRGINASAVGLVFTAVYRLWEVGYLTNASAASDSTAAGGRVNGRSLADEPWLTVIAVCTYAGNKWFDVPAAIGIMAGGVLGIAWWGATQT